MKHISDAITRDHAGPAARRLAAVGAVLASFACAWTSDPAPFRLDDAIAGRPYDYTDRWFVHQFTYRFRTERRLDWARSPHGIRSSVGSVRSTVFLVSTELRGLWAFDDTWDGEVRFRRDEDFDGRYDSILTGLGARVGDPLRVSLLGDIVGDKGDIDVHAEATWLVGDCQRVRTAIVAGDATFNDKSDRGHYHRRPYTLFLEYAGVVFRDAEVFAWGNWNSDVDVDLVEDDLRFRYEQFSSGILVDAPLIGNWRWTAEGAFERGSRDWEYRSLPASVSRMERGYRMVALETRRREDEGVSPWVGVRHLALDEDRWESAEKSDSARNETLWHAGISMPLPRLRARFWPGLYINRLSRPRTEESPDNRVEKETWVLKAAFPLEFSFAGGAAVTLNQTVSLGRTRNGGGNVQVSIPF